VEHSLPNFPLSVLILMTEWQLTTANLEKLLKFKLDCPQCRMWEIAFKDRPKTILLKCTGCGLQLQLLKKSLSITLNCASPSLSGKGILKCVPRSNIVW
jgi:hypothetical protein